MTLLELIDAHASATAEARTTENLGDIEHLEREAFKLRAEIARRLALARDDVSIMFTCHLDNDTHSQSRQRELIKQHAADVATGRYPYPIVKHCRKNLS